MSDAANLFDLAAKISVDASQSDKALTETQKKVLALAQQFSKTETTAKSSLNKTGTAVKDLDREFVRLSASSSGLHTQFVSLGTGLSSMTGLLGIAAIGVGAFVAGVIAAGNAVFELAKHTMEVGGHLYDLSQQTNFSVETLSALGNAADTSGGSLDSITASLGIFQKHLDDANTGTDKSSRILKMWAIDLNDNEKALAQVLGRLSSMNEGTKQTAYALDLFGRSGKQMLGILKDSGGDLEKFKEQMKAAGLSVSLGLAKKADDASDDLTRLKQRISILGAELGEHFLPIVNRVVMNMTKFLRDNKQEIIAWGQSFATIIGYAPQFASAMHVAAAALNPFIGQLRIIIDSIRMTQELMDKVFGGPFAGLKGGVGASALGVGGQASAGIPGVADTPDKARKAATPRDAALELLKQLTRQYNDLSTSTELDRINLQLLEKAYAGINPKVAEQIRKTAELIDVKKLSDEATKANTKAEEEANRVSKSVIDSIVEQRNAIQDLLTGMPAWKRQALDFIEAKKEEGFAWEDNTDKVYLARAGYLAVLESMKAVHEERLKDAADVADKFKKEDKDVADKKAKELEDKIEKFNDKIKTLAGDLTNVIDRALSDGFERGIKAGLISFAQGILDMIRSAALQALEKKLFEVFSKALGGSGGGKGIWSTIIGIAGGIVGGAAGGGRGAGGLGGFGYEFASGGIVPGVDKGFDSVPAMLRPGEMVLNKQQQGAMGGNVYITVYAKDAQSFASRDTQAQLMRQITRAQQKRALTG